MEAKAESIVPVSAALKNFPPVLVAISLSVPSSRSARILLYPTLFPLSSKTGKGT